MGKHGGGLKPTIPYEWRPEYPFSNYFAGSMRIHDLWTQLRESIAGLQTWNFFKPSCRKICRASLAAFRPSWHGNLCNLDPKMEKSWRETNRSLMFWIVMILKLNLSICQWFDLFPPFPSYEENHTKPFINPFMALMKHPWISLKGHSLYLTMQDPSSWVPAWQFPFG